jgi:hypothetical protein
MKGFPKHLNTRFDVEYCLEHYPAETKAFLTVKLAEVKQWQATGKLKDGAAGITSSTHKVVEVKDQTTSEVKERYQYEYKDDPNCELFKLGYTVKETEVILAGKKG